MIVPEKAWMEFISVLRKCSDMAEADMAGYMNSYDTSTPEGRKAAVDYAYALVSKYGEASAEMSCQMYDAIAAATGEDIPEAEPHVPDYGDVAKATYGAFKSTNPSYEVPSAVNRQVKFASVDTTMKNAIRDGAEWAWIPQGDTCAFCLTLASNGWQPASKAALKGGHAEHIHKHCDCTYCIRFDADTTVEGYDPEMYRRMYDEAEGSSSKEKINSMRRGKNVLQQMKAVPMSRYHVNRDDQLYKNLQNVKPVPGYEDFACHGVPDQALVEYETTNGIIVRYNGREYADIVRCDPKYEGGNVRLLSCGAGSKGNEFAQEFANALGKGVLAPTEKLWVAENGELFISDNDILVNMWYNDGKIDDSIKSTGEWKPFTPNGGA